MNDLQAEFDAATDRLTAARLLYEQSERENLSRAEGRARAIAFVNAQETYEKARIALELSKYQGVIDEMSSSEDTHGGGGGINKRFIPNACPHCGNPNYDYTGDGYGNSGDIEAYYSCDKCDYEWAENPYSNEQSGGGDCPDYDHRHFTPIGLHWRAISDIGVNYAPLWRRLREWYELSTLEALQDLIDVGYVQPIVYGADDDRPEYTLTAAGMAYLAFCDGGSA